MTPEKIRERLLLVSHLKLNNLIVFCRCFALAARPAPELMP
jgi:hypothetical protein